MINTRSKAEKLNDDAAIIAVVLILFYLAGWMLCVSLNRDQCHSSGADYSSTSLIFPFSGKCKVSGIEVDAESIGRE